MQPRLQCCSHWTDCKRAHIGQAVCTRCLSHTVSLAHSWQPSKSPSSSSFFRCSSSIFSTCRDKACSLSCPPAPSQLKVPRSPCTLRGVYAGEKRHPLHFLCSFRLWKWQLVVRWRRCQRVFQPAVHHQWHPTSSQEEGQVLQLIIVFLVDASHAGLLCWSSTG